MANAAVAQASAGARLSPPAVMNRSRGRAVASWSVTPATAQPLTEPRGIEPAAGADVEVAAGLVLQREAAGEDLVDFGRAAGEVKLAAVETADLTFGPI